MSTLEHMEVNEASEYLITKIQTTMDIFAPERTIRVSQKKTQTTMDDSCTIKICQK